MSRGVGASEAIREAVAGFEPAFAILTQLGDVWFLAAVTLAAFWLGRTAPLGQWDRNRGLVLFGTALCAFAATGVLKAVFGFPRPPLEAIEPSGSGLLTQLYVAAATATGYGFPSGHAIASTAVYGSAAVLVGRWSRRVRVAVAASLVAIVGLCRVALGVHYVVDVLAGVAVGLVLVGFATVLRDRPRAMLELGSLLSLGWVAAAGFGSDPVTLLGLTAGLWLGWWRYGPTVVGREPTVRDAAVTTVFGLALLGPTLGYAATAASGWMSFAMAVAGGLGVVALPLVLGEKTVAD